MESKPSVAPTEDHIKEMMAYWKASGNPSFSMEEAIEWCGSHHPNIAPKRFGFLLRCVAANRKHSRQPASDLVWQLAEDRFISYDPDTDPVPGSRDAAAWVIRLALQERPDVVQGEILDQYCARLAAAIDTQKAPGKTLQEMADGLAELVLKDEMEPFLSQVSELGAAAYFKTAYPVGFDNHIPNPGSSSTGPVKNFDFRFQAEGIRFNVEVKAFSKAFDPDREGGVKYFLPEHVKQPLHEAGTEMTSTLATTIGRFLSKADSQLFRRGDDMNVVLLCCNDPDEYADVMESLHGPFGLISASRAAGDSPTLPDSVIPNLSLMTNIDAVVVCLSGFLHAGIVNKVRFSRAYKLDDCSLDKPERAWDFRYTFPVGFWLHRPPTEQQREEGFHKAFNSHLWLLLDFRNHHNGDWQAAVFSLINNKIS